MNHAELDSLKGVFQMFDKDLKGHINTRDLEDFLLGFGQRLSDRDLECLFRRLTHGHSTKLMTKEQFCVLLHNSVRQTDDPYHTFFETVLDADGDGTITEEELKKSARLLGSDKISSEEATEMLREVSHPTHLIEVCSLVGKGKIITVEEGHEAASAGGGGSRVGKKKGVVLSDSSGSSSDEDFNEETSKTKKTKSAQGESAKHEEEGNVGRKEASRRKKSKAKTKVRKVRDDYRYRPFFRLVDLGMRKDLVKLKMTAEFLDLDPKLIDTPEAPAPP
jgi:Ca2+-binding EF-hand superfamily protein